MKTACGKPVPVIAFIRTLLVVLAVAACTVAAEDLETLRKKAEAGDVAAQFNLGLLYDNGEGVRKNAAEAAKWVRKAAEQGYAKAQNSLGLMYAKGMGVPEDSVAAYAWYSVAATYNSYNAPKKRDAIKRELTLSQLEKGEVMARKIFERIEKRKAAAAIRFASSDSSWQ